MGPLPLKEGGLGRQTPEGREYHQISILGAEKTVRAEPVLFDGCAQERSHLSWEQGLPPLQTWCQSDPLPLGVTGTPVPTHVAPESGVHAPSGAGQKHKQDPRLWAATWLSLLKPAAYRQIPAGWRSCLVRPAGVRRHLHGNLKVESRTRTAVLSQAGMPRAQRHLPVTDTSDAMTSSLINVDTCVSTVERL